MSLLAWARFLLIAPFLLALAVLDYRREGRALRQSAEQRRRSA